MNPQTTNPTAAPVSLRPFRLGGLDVARLDPSTPPGDTPSDSSWSCDVLLLLDFVGASGEGLAAHLDRARKRLARGGVLLLALPNRFGLRFWSGCPEPLTGSLFAPLTGDAAAGASGTVSRHELAAQLAGAGFTSHEWFFPLLDPRVAAPAVAFASLCSEQLIAVAPEVAAEISTQRPSADAVHPRLDLFPEALVARELARAGLLPEFANLFLVAASPREAAATSAALWARLRPPKAEIGWHYALARRAPIETTFERSTDPTGTPGNIGNLGNIDALVVCKRPIDPQAAVDAADFQWIGRERAPLVPGAPLRLILQEHLVAGRGAEFLRDFGAFAAHCRERFAHGESLAGEAVDAILTNATRDADGAFHLFDLEWRARAEVPVSWWILRNVLACLELRGPPMAGLANGTALYAALCRQQGVEAQLAVDLARELRLAVAVRNPNASTEASIFADAMELPWPVAVLQGGDATALQGAASAAFAHQRLVTDYRELERWSKELEEESRRAAAERLQENARFTADYRRLESWARDLESQLLRHAASAEIAALAQIPLATASAAPGAPRPKIRAVVIHHRNSELLDHCLRAALASTGVELDIVLFENECHEALPEWIAGEPRIHRIGSARTVGFGAANNRAVAWSREHLPPADALFFLNNDAVVRTDTLARLAAVLAEHPDAAAAGPLILIWGAEDHLNSLGLNLSTAGEAWDEGIGVPVARHLPLPGREEALAVTGSALLVRQEAFEAVGGWSELFDFYMEDIDLCLKLRRRGQSIWLVPDAVVAHAVSATAGPDSEFKLFLFWRNRWILMLLQWPWRKLLRALPAHLRQERASYRARRLAGEGAVADRQRRAWLGALARLPRILAARLRHGRDESWWKLMKPPGSAPAITLPEVVSRGRPWESATVGGLPR